LPRIDKEGLMTTLRMVLIALAAVALMGVSGAVIPRSSAHAAGARCQRGSVPARVGGKRMCLRAGQRCKKRYERQYRRHGFHCQAGRLRKLRKHPPPPPPPPAPPCPALTGTGGLHSLASVCLGGTPTGAALGFGSLWVRLSSGYRVYRIDTATARVDADVSGLPQAPFGFTQVLAAGEGAVWTSNVAAGSVSRIDPATNKVVATIPVWPTNACGPAPSTSCSSPMGIAFTPGAVWVVLHHEWRVVRIDPATNRVVATISLGSGPPQSGPQDLSATNGFVYVGGDSGFGGLGEVVRIDPATNAVTPLLAPAIGCDAKAATAGHVWQSVADGTCGPNVGGSLVDIDSTSKSIAGTVALGGVPYAVAADGSSVWALTDRLSRVSQATHAVTGTVPLPGGESYLAADAQQLWLATPGGVYRIGQ
jgi:YVTN family beta-propeller protein